MPSATLWSPAWAGCSVQQTLIQSQLPSRPLRVQTLSPSSQGASIPKWREACGEKINACFFFSSFFGHAVKHAGLQIPDQGSNWCPLRWKCEDLTTGLPRKPQWTPPYSPRGFLDGTEKHCKLTEGTPGNTRPRKSASGPDECLFNNCLVMIISRLHMAR